MHIESGRCLNNWCPSHLVLGDGEPGDVLKVIKGGIIKLSNQIHHSCLKMNRMNIKMYEELRKILKITFCGLDPPTQKSPD